MKKLLVALLILGLAVSLFAGGGNQAPKTTGGKIPITLGLWELTQFGGDAFGDYVENKFNIDIIPVLQEWSDYAEKIRLWGATNDLPDTFSGYPVQEPWFGEFVDQGLIRTIPYSMISKYPNVKKVFDNHEMSQIMRRKLGDIYYFPRPVSLAGHYIGSNGGLYYRKDWAQKLGYNTRPTDMETYYRMLKDMVDKDASGTGRTYGFTGGLDPLYVAFGAFPGRWVKGPNNQYIPGWADEGPMVQALTWLRRAYMERVLDPEFPTDHTIIASKFAQGTFGSMGRVVTGVWVQRHVIDQFGGANPGLDPLAAVDVIGGVSSRPGGIRYHLPEIDSCGILFKADLEDAKLDKLLALYDWLTGDEGGVMRYWGFKDIDYRVNANGSFTKIVSDDLRVKYPSIYLEFWPNWGWDWEGIDSPDVPQGAKDLAWEWQMEVNAAANNAKSIVDELASVTITDERNRFQFNDGGYIRSQLTQIITGSADVTAMYRAFIANANSQGLQNVIRSVNSAR